MNLLTNVSIIFMLFKIATDQFTHQSTSYPDAFIFMSLLVCSCYQLFQENRKNEIDKKFIKLDQIRLQQNSFDTRLNRYDQMYETLTKQSEDVKKMISDSNISRAFNPRNKML